MLPRNKATPALMAFMIIFLVLNLILRHNPVQLNTVQQRWSYASLAQRFGDGAAVGEEAPIPVAINIADKPRKRLPDVLILGVKKCGTMTLGLTNVCC